jgi:hypothetical protein
VGPLLPGTTIAVDGGLTRAVSDARRRQDVDGAAARRFSSRAALRPVSGRTSAAAPAMIVVFDPSRPDEA